MTLSIATSPCSRRPLRAGLALAALACFATEGRCRALLDPAAALAQEGEEDDQDGLDALRAALTGQGVNLEVGNIRIEGEGLDEETATALAELGTFVNQMMEEDGGSEVFGGERHYRIRLRPGERPNHYCAGVAAVTMTEPSAQWIRDGAGGHDPAWTFLQTVVESNWSKIVRPVWSMPLAVRDGLSRAIVEHYLPRIVEEFGEEWWLGSRPPVGTPWALPADSVYLRDRDRVQGKVRALIQKEGIERLLSHLLHWNTVRLTGAEATLQLAGLLEEVLPPKEGSESDPLLPPLDFETRTPWEGPTLERTKGMRYRLNSRVSATGWYGKWYEDSQNQPRSFHPATAGNPAQLFQVCEHGRWKIRQVDTVLRRVGDFEPGQQFYLLLLDEQGRETFRWAYELAQVPTEAAWLELVFTSNPQVGESFFVAFEFPAMKEGQDLQVGTWPQEGGERSFVLESGRGLRPMPEARDLAIVLQYRVAESNPRQLSVDMIKLFGRPR